MFRYMLEIVKNLRFDHNIYVAILNSDSACTAAKKLDLNIVKAKQKLNSFESDHSSTMIEVSFQ